MKDRYFKDLIKLPALLIITDDSYKTYERR